MPRDVRAIAGRGEPTDLSSLDRQLDTPEQQETAQLYLEAAARAREMAQQDNRLARFDVDAVVGRIDVGELEESFRKDAPALQLLDRAASMRRRQPLGRRWGTVRVGILQPDAVAAGTRFGIRVPLMAKRGAQ